MNTKYGRLADGQIEYAPSHLMVDGALKVNPSEASYLASGWKKVVDEPPAAEDGMDVMVSSWTEDETTVTCVYKQVPHASRQESAKADGGTETGTEKSAGRETNAAGRRIFSKLKLVAALKAADKWVLVKTWLEEKSYYDYYLAAQEFREDNELFAEGLAALKGYAHITDEEVEAILAEAVADE